MHGYVMAKWHAESAAGRQCSRVCVEIVVVKGLKFDLIGFQRKQRHERTARAARAVVSLPAYSPSQRPKIRAPLLLLVINLDCQRMLPAPRHHNTCTSSDSFRVLVGVVGSSYSHESSSTWTRTRAVLLLITLPVAARGVTMLVQVQVRAQAHVRAQACC